jgi:ketosteroid isomerase-like protein
VGTEEKAEVVRRVFAELSRGQPAAAGELFDDSATFDFTRSRGPNQGTYYGRGAIQANWEDFLGAWEEWIVEPLDFIELDDGDLLFSIRGRMTGRDGIELHVRASHIWTIRDGLVQEATFFQTREDALRAAGIPADAAR